MEIKYYNLIIRVTYALQAISFFIRQITDVSGRISSPQLFRGDEGVRLHDSARRDNGLGLDDAALLNDCALSDQHAALHHARGEQRAVSDGNPVADVHVSGVAALERALGVDDDAVLHVGAVADAYQALVAANYSAIPNLCRNIKNVRNI